MSIYFLLIANCVTEFESVFLIPPEVQTKQHNNITSFLLEKVLIFALSPFYILIYMF